MEWVVGNPSSRYMPCSPTTKREDWGEMSQLIKRAGIPAQL